jgi:CHAT domain-containing protein
LAAKGESLYHHFIHHPRQQTYLTSALATYAALTRLIKIMQLSYRSQDYKLYFAGKCFDIYDKAIEVATLLYTLTRKETYKEQAFTFSELSKAWILSEAISEARARKYSGLPAALLDREKNLRRQLIRYELAVEKGFQQRSQSSQKHIKNMQEIYYQFLDQYQKLIASLERNYPRYYQLKFNILPYQLRDVQNRLDPDTALVEYFVGQNQIYTFIITRRGCHLRTVDRSGDWPLTIERFYQAIKKIEEDVFLNLGGQLHQQLIAPILRHLNGVKRLVIVPHDLLFYVPFEALVPGQTKKDSFDKLPYLVKDFSISYHYSANLWLGSHGAGQNLSDKTFVGFAPIFRSRQQLPGQINGSGQRDIVVNNKRYPTLPASEKEISTIQHMFHDRGHRATIFINERASERLFKSNLLKNFSYIHIASHGLMNQIQPKLSGILFHPPPLSSQEDGILFSGETFNLNLKARLIVLSSCESGIGQLVKGEGMVALNRGFLYSGAANIIFSLWKIEDNPTSQLMISLYRHILNNQSLPRALRQAKRSLISRPLYAFPRYWAGFILLGQ